MLTILRPPHLLYRALAQNARGAGDDEEMERFVPIEDLFRGRHFDRQIIVLCVSWCRSFKLSLRDLVIMMADRGIQASSSQFRLRSRRAHR
jgi:hypothetical protein